MEHGMKGSVGMVGIPVSVVVISLIVLAIVGTVIFLIVRNNRMKQDVLKERLVKGEISQQEYTRLLALLKRT